MKKKNKEKKKRSQNSKQQKYDILMLLYTLEVCTYILALIYVYILLIPNIGENVKEKCLENLYCSRYIQTTSFGYSVDLG